MILINNDMIWCGAMCCDMIFDMIYSSLVWCHWCSVTWNEMIRYDICGLVWNDVIYNMIGLYDITIDIL